MRSDGEHLPQTRSSQPGGREPPGAGNTLSGSGNANLHQDGGRGRARRGAGGGGEKCLNRAVIQGRHHLDAPGMEIDCGGYKRASKL